MSEITSIVQQKNNKNRVNIFVDGKYLFSIYSELVYKYNLSIGDTIDRDKLTSMIKKDDFEKAKTKALNMISRVEKSEKVLREKLSDDFDEEIVDMVIDFMKKYSFIDDERFAKRIVNNDVNFKKLGKNRIKQDLYKKGIRSRDIDTAMMEINQDKEIENALYLAKKRFERLRGKDVWEIRKKIYQHLQYKGFGYDVINSVLRTLFDEVEYIEDF